MLDEHRASKFSCVEIQQSKYFPSRVGQQSPSRSAHLGYAAQDAEVGVYGVGGGGRGVGGGGGGVGGGGCAASQQSKVTPLDVGQQSPSSPNL